MWAELVANRTLAAGVRAAVRETQRLRELVSHVDAAFYPLTPIDPTHRWNACETSCGAARETTRRTSRPSRPSSVPTTMPIRRAARFV